jgi:rubrerythrin
VDDDRHHAPALALMAAWQAAPEQRWHCRGCNEIVEGPFEQCWNCGAWRPEAA